MLVLGRKVGEAILVDHDVRIVVLSVDRRGVRLGIEAPATRPVLREELVLEVATENRRAAEAGLPAALADSLSPAFSGPGGAPSRPGPVDCPDPESTPAAPAGRAHGDGE